MLSELLQNNDITIVRANQLINREIRIFRSMKEKDGLYVAEASKAVAVGTFKNVTLRPATKNAVAINKNQFFFESLATNLEKRLAPNADMEHVNKFKVLNPDFWPEGEDDMIQYGEQEITDLCTKFRMNFSNAGHTQLLRLQRQWREESTKRPEAAVPLLAHTASQQCRV